MNEGYREIVLEAHRIQDRASMAGYMREVFGTVFLGRTLDALNDSLSEVTENVCFVLTQRNVSEICENRYAYRVLLVIGRAAEENPHIRVTFRP